MAITFQGGQSMPAQGTAAYNALVGAQNSGTSGAGNYDAKTGNLSVGGNQIYSPTTGGTSTGGSTVTSPIISGPSYSPIPATQPVVTSSAAYDDYQAKVANFNALQASIAQQTDAKAKADAQAKSDAAAKAVNDSELNLKQQDLDRLKAESDAKLAAVKAATNDSGSNTTDNTKSADGNTTNGSTPGTTNGNAGNTPNPSSPLKDEGNQYKSDIASVQASKDAVTQGMLDNLNNLKNGTIPLNGPQAALIGSLQTQLIQRENEQKVSNSAYTGQVAEAGFRAGGEYTPEQYSGQIANAISYGTAKIQELDNTAAQTIAKMTVDFQQSNYDNINKGYELLMKQLDDKSSAITSLHNDTMSILKDERDQKQKLQDKVDNISLEAAKQGAPQDVIAKINGATSQANAIMAAGEYLTKGNWDFQKVTDGLGNESIIAINKNDPKISYVVGGSNGGNPSHSDITSHLTSGATDPTGQTNPATGLSFAQYGLLANTDFNPKDTIDALSQKYLDTYLKSGVIPSASTMGRNMKPEVVAKIDARARDLYFKATGQSMPTPQNIKAYQNTLATNINMANNLKIQETTVKQNVDLSIANMKANDLNSAGFKPLDSLINTVSDMFNDPAVGRLLAQNSTIQNELGSLLAVKNASGTTVYDKLNSAGIITPSDSQEQINNKVNALLSEAANFASSINMANADIYKQIDPLMQDSNNPLRSAQMRPSNQKVDDYMKGNPDKIPQLKAANDAFKAQNGRDMTDDEMTQAFPEMNLALPPLTVTSPVITPTANNQEKGSWGVFIE